MWNTKEVFHFPGPLEWKAEDTVEAKTDAILCTTRKTVTVDQGGVNLNVLLLDIKHIRQPAAQVPNYDSSMSTLLTWAREAARRQGNSDAFEAHMSWTRQSNKMRENASRYFAGDLCNAICSHGVR